MGSQEQRATAWTFLTNHSHVLACLVDQPDVRLREVAARVGITERAVQRIVADLERAGVIARYRQGRRNHYRVFAGQPLRHPIEAHRAVRDLLRLLRQPARKTLSIKRGVAGRNA